MKTPTSYPPRDFRRLLAVLAAVDALGVEATLVNLEKMTQLDRKTVSSLLMTAARETGVHINKTGPVYQIRDWGPVLNKKGAVLALMGALNAHKIESTPR